MAEITITVEENGERVYTNRGEDLADLATQLGEAITVMVNEGSANLDINVVEEVEE